MPGVASYAFNSAENLAAPVDQRNNEIRLNTEWANPRGMFRLDYWGSFFDNPLQTLTWDNPIRATDYNNGLLPPSGPYDSSGYSNGNGAAFGQAALWPSNNLNSAGATGMIKLLPRTTVNGNVQVTYMRQNEALLPWTLNTSINNPPVLNAFPGLRRAAARLGRDRGERDERAIHAQQPAVSLSSPSSRATAITITTTARRTSMAGNMSAWTPCRRSWPTTRARPTSRACRRYFQIHAQELRCVRHLRPAGVRRAQVWVCQ